MHDARLEVLKEVLLKIQAFWGIVLHRLVNIYWHKSSNSSWPWRCSIMLIQNIGHYLPDGLEQHPRKLESYRIPDLRILSDKVKLWYIHLAVSTNVINIPICSVKPHVSCCTMTVILYRKACHSHTSPLITLVLFHNEKFPLVATCSTKQSRPSRPDYSTEHHNNSTSSVLITWTYCCVPQTVPSATWSMHKCLATFHSTAQTLLRFKTHLLHWYVFFTLLSIQPYITCQHTNIFSLYFITGNILSKLIPFQHV